MRNFLCNSHFYILYVFVLFVEEFNNIILLLSDCLLLIEGGA